MSDLGLARVDREADVVGITADPSRIRSGRPLPRPRQEGRARWHLSLAPEESLAHADAVVAGETEYVWPDVLADLAAGRVLDG